MPHGARECGTASSIIMSITRCRSIVGDRLRPEESRDPFGVEQAKEQLRKVYPMIEQELGSKPWIMGDAFTLADCAAAPALFYANIVVPFDPSQKALIAYLDRLMARPSYARVLREAGPYFKYYPFEKDLRERYPLLGDRGAGGKS